MGDEGWVREDTFRVAPLGLLIFPLVFIRDGTDGETAAYFKRTESEAGGSTGGPQRTVLTRYMSGFGLSSRAPYSHSPSSNY